MDVDGPDDRLNAWGGRGGGGGAKLYFYKKSTVGNTLGLGLHRLQESHKLLDHLMLLYNRMLLYNLIYYTI